MYKVALVQNQSEMSHYSYADARPLLADFGYETLLYTAQNINTLSDDLQNLEIDAIFFASNALNDKTIREETFSDSFQIAFRQFIDQGKGCLVLSQLRIGSDGRDKKSAGTLEFLPKELKKVRAIAKAVGVDPEKGNFFKQPISDRHPCFLYPTTINFDSIKQNCLTFKGIKGVYWHYWSGVDISEWDILLYDQEDDLQKPLIISSKESDQHRIVLASLTLDWQKQRALLENLLVYVVEGRHHTAFIQDVNRNNIAFDYLLDSLKAQKYSLRVYDRSGELETLKENIEKGIHSIIVLDSNEMEYEHSNFSRSIQNYALEGKIKIIGIEQGNQDLKKFYVIGREKYSLRILHNTEIKIQKELKDGYIDQSFWSTVETLQELNQIDEKIGTYNSSTLEEVAKESGKHDRSGSYDGTFGVTCGFLWIRAKYYGVNHEMTKKTLNWIRMVVDDYEDRERVLAYSILNELGLATEQELEKIKTVLERQQFEHLSEVDLIVFLRAANMLKLLHLIPSLVSNLKRKQQPNGYWIDLATSAQGASILVDVLKELNQNPVGVGGNINSLKKVILEMLFQVIINIQKTIKVKEADIKSTYPWDNKASTTLKCINAWLKFERELLDLPVYEVIDSLKSYSGISTSISANKSTLSVLEELKEESKEKINRYNQMKQEKEEQDRKHRNEHKLLKYFSLSFLVFLSILLYVFISIAFSTTINFSQILKQTFIDHFSTHLTIITTVLGSGFIGWFINKTQRDRH